MSIDANKAVVRGYVEAVLVEGRLDSIGTYLAMLGCGQRVAALCNAFPDREVTLDAIVGEGDLVAISMTLRGSHEAAIRGIAPTGSRVTMTGTALYRLADGKIVDAIVHWDWLALLG